MRRENLRNIAIIAHVDHGKTTLVDGMFRQSGVFRENQRVQERVMDSNDLERERGITILSKNTGIQYGDVKINIVDTPGHADFGGEVERVLTMVDGVLLLIDAFEGPMPQTRFVLKKALELKLKPVIVVNKMDRPDARPLEVLDLTYDLFIDLGADEEQLDFPVVYASAKNSTSSLDIDEIGTNLEPLFNAILEHIPAPTLENDGPLQMIVSTIDYDDYVGRIAIGRINRGSMTVNQQVALCKTTGEKFPGKVVRIYNYHGLKRQEQQEASWGEIVAVVGIDGVNIGDTITAIECPEPLPFIKIDEPTLSMEFSVNTSPFSGQEGDYVTSRQLRARLTRELESNVALRVEETDSPDTFRISGRGELHLSILIETMRREGYEIQVSKPKVIFKVIDGKKQEPYELATIDIPEEFIGVVMEKMGIRKGELVNMKSQNQGYLRLEFLIPARGLIGYRSEFLTDTKGNGILNHTHHSYGQIKGEMLGRNRGSLVALEIGEATTYGIFNAQGRGVIFVKPGVKIYEGMVIGENTRDSDMVVNVCKKKKLDNMRASGSDDSLVLSPPREMSLEQALNFIADDELLEITPKNFRVRKRLLSEKARRRS
ncbi:MAG: translational GTPase TypA [Halanaerobiales bacterium]|nr:translational GTPase TypA [Halanaerobiales bacterium]